MAKTLDLTIKIAGKIDPSLAKAMGIAKQQTSGLAAGMSGFAKATIAAAAAATAAATGMTVACVKRAAELEKEMSNVKTLLVGTAEETAARTEELTQDVLDISLRTGVGTSELTAGLYQTISAFEDSADSAARLEIATKSARAGNADLTQTVNMLAAVTKAYGDTSAEAVQHAADLGFETIRLGQTTLPELAEGLQKATGSAALLGVRQEELYAGFATLTGVMGNTAVTGTGLNALYATMLKPTKKLTSAVQSLGYESAFAMVQEKGIGDTIKTLYDSMSETDFAAMFSKRDLRAATMLAQQYDVYIRKLGELEDASGATDRAFETQIDNATSCMEIIKNAGDVLMKSIGRQLLPYLKDFVKAAVPMVRQAVTNITAKFEEWAPVIEKVFGYVSTHGPQVTAAIIAISTALAGLNFAPQISKALGALGGLKIGGFEVGGLFNLGKLFTGGQKAGGAMLGGIKGAMSGLPALMTNMKLDGAGPLAMLGSLFSGTKAANAAGAVSGYFGNIRNAFKRLTIAPSLQAAITSGINGIKSAPLIQAMGNKLSTVFSSAGRALSNVGNLASVIGKGFSLLLANGIGAIKGTKLVSGLGGVFGVLGSIWGPIAGGFGSLFAGAAPVIGIISGIIAVVSILGDHIEDIRGVIGNVFGTKGLEVFDAFTAGVQGVADKIIGLFSPENLAAVRTAIEGAFGPKAASAFDGIVGIAQSVMGVISQIATFATTYVKPIIQDIFGFITGTVMPGIMQVFAAAAPYISGIISNLGTSIMAGMTIAAQAIQLAMPILQGIISVLLSVASVVVPAVLAGFQAFSAGISNIMMAIQGIFGGLISFVTGVFTGNWSQAWEGIKQIFGNAFDALVELCKTPINAVIGIINGVISSINGMGFTIPEWVPIIGGHGFTINLPTIPMLAEGGFTNGPSIAGENGTEAVISFLPGVRGQNIANWQQAGQMLGVSSAQAAGAANLPTLQEIPSGATLGGGSAPSITFAPNITIQGNASREDVTSAVGDAYQQFVQFMNQWQRTQARTSY